MTTTKNPKDMIGSELLAAVKIGKRNRALFNAVCEEIDRRVVKRNLAGKPVTDPTAEMLAILARRGVMMPVARFGSVSNPIDPDETEADKARKRIDERIEATPVETLVDETDDARKRVLAAADLAAASLAKANGGKGFVKARIAFRKAALATLDA